MVKSNAQEALDIAWESYKEALRAKSFQGGNAPSRMVTNQEIAQLWAQIQNLKQVVAAENGESSDGGVAYVQFLPPR